MENDSENIITVKIFDNPFEANLAKAKLESGGIECFLTNENFSALYPLFNNSATSIKLNIFEKDHDTALDILNNSGDINSEFENNQ